MNDLYMRTNLIINASIENSRDLKEILEIKKSAGVLYNFARDYKYRKFDVADQPEDGKFTLRVKWNSEKAEQSAKRLIILAEKMEKEAKEFYESIGLSMCGAEIGESPVTITRTPRHMK